MPGRLIARSSIRNQFFDRFRWLLTLWLRKDCDEESIRGSQVGAGIDAGPVDAPGANQLLQPDLRRVVRLPNSARVFHSHEGRTGMRKAFTAPKLVPEATLARLTLFEITSGAPG